MRDKKVKNMAVNGVLAAVYVVLTMVNPFSWSIIQFRASDMLSALAYHRERYIAGFLIGCTLANIFSPLGMVDMAFGFLSEGIPIAIFVLGSGKSLPMWIKNIGRALIIGIVIGIELTAVYHTPFIMGFISLFASEVIIFAVGSVLMGTIMRLSERAI